MCACVSCLYSCIHVYVSTYFKSILLKIKSYESTNIFFFKKKKKKEKEKLAFDSK